MADLTPALTPDQWAERLPRIEAFCEYVNECQECSVGQGIGCHGAAAVCLYGQPFGFTRQDVALLKSAAAEWADVSPPALEALNRAARIAALLPPDQSP